MMRKVFIYFCLFISLFILTGCSLHKKAISFDEFQSITMSSNYHFLDVTEQFSYDKRIKKAGLAATSVWQVEFYIFDSKDSADAMFQSNVKSFKEVKGSTSFEEKINMFNYKTYALTTNAQYMYVCRVDNTVAYSRVPVEYRDKVIKYIGKIGY